MHRRRVVRSVLAFALSASLAGCGNDSPAPAPAANAGPAARWRRGADESVNGKPALIEALKRCRVTIAWRFDTGLEGAETVDLAPGDAVRVRASAVPAGQPSTSSAPEAEKAKGRTRPNAFLLGYAIDDGADRQHSDLVWTRDRAPWTRVVAADIPPTWRDLPMNVEVPLIALAVVDAADTADLRLDLASPPRAFSPRGFAADDLVHVASLVLTVSAR